MASVNGGFLTLLGSIGVGLAYVYTNEFKQLVAWCYYKFRGKFMQRIVIDARKNPRIAHSIKEALKEKFLKNNEHSHRVLISNDKQNEIGFELEEGWYQYESGIYIRLDFQEIEIMSYLWNDIDKLIECQTSIYVKYTSGASAKIAFYFPKGNDWHPSPVFREIRIFPSSSITDNMRKVITDLQENFLNNRDRYEVYGYPYRYGIIICGAPGTGKSQIIEWIASVLKRPIFLPSLNSNDMCDADLIRMISQVPKNSCIGLEELDHQLKTMGENVNNTVSLGGLLTALDGPQRLNEGVIVVATTNNIGFLDDHGIRKSFVRPGRFDRVWEFTL